MNELKHHGVQGQKWGVRNGPPYPLSRQGITRKEYNNKMSSKIGGNKTAKKNGAAHPGWGDRETYKPSITKKFDKLSKITKKMERQQKKVDKANLKKAKEESKTLFRNEDKITKAKQIMKQIIGYTAEPSCPLIILTIS